jgi:ketosteroid isomerase-like protein
MRGSSLRKDVFAAAIAIVTAVFAVPGLAAAKDDLLATDKAFSAMSAQLGNHAAFLAYMTDDARLYQGDHPPILGKAAAAAAFAAEEKADPSYPTQKLVWTPLEAEASPDGVLGYTRGTWIFAAPKADGTSVTLTGYYVTAWRKQADGVYKFCLDIGGADKPAQH